MIRARALQIVNKSWRQLTRREKAKYVWFIFLQIVNNLLDVVAITIIGIVFLSLSGGNDEGANELVEIDLKIQKFGFKADQFAEVVSVMAGTAIFLFIIKSIISLILARIATSDLATISVRRSLEEYEKRFSQDVDELLQTDRYRTSFSLTTGSDVATIEVLSQFLMLISEIALFVFVFALLLIVDFQISVFLGVYFCFLILVLSQLIGFRMKKISRERAELSVKVQRTIQDNLNMFREVAAHGGVKTFVNEFEALRKLSSRYLVKERTLAIVPKQLIEMSLYLAVGIGILLVAVLELRGENLSVLSFFLIGGARLVPASIRLNSSLLAISNSVALVDFAFPSDESRTLEGKENQASLPIVSRDERVRTSIQSWNGQISIRKLKYGYREAATIINNLNLEMKTGNCYLLKGASGSGKSTFLDLLAGALTPSSGTISIGGLPPKHAREQWPGVIGYLPQKIHLRSDSILNNLTLFRESELVDLEKVWHLLEIFGLADEVSKMSDGVKTEIGEVSSRLSGGQVQRLGLTRLFYADPKILLLDEPTSALDSRNELRVWKVLEDQKQDKLIVLSSHVASSLSFVDKEIEINNMISEVSH